MRRILIIVFILIVTMSISTFVDQYKMAELESTSIHSISYEGSGEGGTLVAGNRRLALSPINPHVGSTKDDQLALAYGGRVFPFGLLRSSESLVTDIDGSDTALLTRQHSYLLWPSFSDAHVTWNRAEYYKLNWRKQNGAKLEMVWRLASNSSDGKTWGTEITTDATVHGLIRIDISNPVDKSQR